METSYKNDFSFQFERYCLRDVKVVCGADANKISRRYERTRDIGLAAYQRLLTEVFAKSLRVHAWRDITFLTLLSCLPGIGVRSYRLAFTIHTLY